MKMLLGCNDSRKQLLLLDLCSSVWILSLCLASSEATFFSRRHHEPEYPSYIMPEHDSLHQEPHAESECQCECPKDKFIRVEVPKTQVQYFPIDDKELADAHRVLDAPVGESLLEEGMDDDMTDIPVDKSVSSMYPEMDGQAHKEHDGTLLLPLPRTGASID